MKTTIAEFAKAPALSRAATDLLPAGPTICGIIGACVAAWFSRMPIPIENPILLAAAAAFLLLPANGRTLGVLQKVVGIYLVAAPFNEIYPQYVTVPLLSQGLLISYSVAPLLFCAAGFFLMRLRRCTEEGPEQSAMRIAWLAALGTIVLHMILLAALFRRTYGYGYEHDPYVLAHLSLYFLLFLILWSPLDRRDHRTCVALTVGAFYLFLAIRGCVASSAS